MEARDVMTPDPACCSPSDSVKDAAALMVGNDCGEIPVVDEGGQLVGVITDRDIACSCVSAGRTADTPVGEVMSSALGTVPQHARGDQCCRMWEDNKVRSISVGVDHGKC